MKDTNKPLIKPPKTYEEQIEILISKKLNIKNKEIAIETLKRINYYRLSGYMLHLKTNDYFIPGITFEFICNIYNFDKKLRQLLLEKIEDIEIAFRTQIAYFFGHKYGPLGYLDSKNFDLNPKCQEQYKEIIRDLNMRLEKSKKNELFIQHHYDKYQGQFPIWVAIEVFPFGLLSKLFSILKGEDKQQISQDYYKQKYFYIESWIRHLSYIRNICAHYGRIYNKKLVIKPSFPKKDKKINPPTNFIFNTFLILKKLSINSKDWSNYILGLKNLLNENSQFIKKELIGFPEDWYKILS